MSPSQKAVNLSSCRATLRANSGTANPSFSRYLASEMISSSSGAKFTTNSQLGGSTEGRGGQRGKAEKEREGEREREREREREGERERGRGRGERKEGERERKEGERERGERERERERGGEKRQRRRRDESG